MLTAEQQAANTKNAHSSTGPRTEEGKARSSQNALKHGAFAKTVLLPGESQAEFDALHAGLLYDHNPEGQAETDLVQGLAEIQWRLNRLRHYETAAVGAALEAGDFDCKALLNCTLIEQRLLRAYQTTLKLLKDAQAPRLARREQDLRTACELRQLHQTNNEPWQPQDDGFVFSLREIDARIHLHRRLEAAAKAAKCRTHPDLPKAA